MSSGTWANTPLAQAQSGSFRITFDATPSDSNVDAVHGLSSGPASAYANMFVAVRFNTSGHIDARNGSAYAAASAIPYAARTTYHFILDVNVATHTYNAYVMIGSTQTTIGTNLAFRNELAPTSSLSYVAAMTTTGSSTICNITLSNSSMAPSIITQPVSQSVTAGQMATFSVATTGSAPLTYQWMKNGVAISGANSSNYSTPVTTITDNGAQFTVSVSNASGTAHQQLGAAHRHRANHCAGDYFAADGSVRYRRTSSNFLRGRHRHGTDDVSMEQKRLTHHRSDFLSVHDRVNGGF